jgi:serine/threonine protein kinase
MVSSSSGKPPSADEMDTARKATRLQFNREPDEDTATQDMDQPVVSADPDGLKMTRRLSDAGPGRCPQCATTYSGNEKFCPFDGSLLETVIDWDPDADPLIGCTVSDRYMIECVLAQGGMGTVYKVRHTKLESLFAMKVLHRDLAQDPDVADMLIAEARATAVIGHPNIVAVADFGEIDKSVLAELDDLKLPYFVMEYLSGPSLSDVLRDEAPLASDRVAHIIGQVAGALSAAHKAGIIHRDLKPENIRITHDEVGGEIAKVLDFGVAKVMGSSKKTQAGMVFGTPHYMSPEQGQGKEIDHRTDIYAVGVLMYECLTGAVPFASDTFMGVITKHMFQVPEPPKQATGQVDLESIMMQCLEKSADARYQSMIDLVEDLARASGGEQTFAGIAKPKIRLRDTDRHSVSRLSIPIDGLSPLGERRWLWAGVTVAAAAIAAWLVIHYVGSANDVTTAPPAGEDTSAAAVPQQTAAPRGVPSTPPTIASTSPTSTTSPAPPATVAAPLGKPTPKPAAPPKTVPRPTPRPTPRTGGDVVDPWD